MEASLLRRTLSQICQASLRPPTPPQCSSHLSTGTTHTHRNKGMHVHANTHMLTQTCIEIYGSRRSTQGATCLHPHKPTPVDVTTSLGGIGSFFCFNRMNFWKTFDIKNDAFISSARVNRGLSEPHTKGLCLIYERQLSRVVDCRQQIACEKVWHFICFLCMSVKSSNKLNGAEFKSQTRLLGFHSSF